MQKTFTIEGLPDLASGYNILEGVRKIKGVETADLDSDSSQLNLQMTKDNKLLFQLVEYVVKRVDSNLILKEV